YFNSLLGKNASIRFSDAAQVPVLVHVGAIPFVVPIAALLLRRTADRSRRLLLPRAAARLHRASIAARIAWACVAAAIVITAGVLSHGFDIHRLPSGAVCDVAKSTCDQAAKWLHQVGTEGQVEVHTPEDVHVLVLQG